MPWAGLSQAVGLTESILPPVARHLAAIPGEMAVRILDENRLQLVRHFLVKVEADRRRAFALPVVDLQPERVPFAGGEFGRVAPQLPVLEFLAITTGAPSTPLRGPKAHLQASPGQRPGNCHPTICKP